MLEKIVKYATIHRRIKIKKRQLKAQITQFKAKADLFAKQKESGKEWAWREKHNKAVNQLEILKSL